MTTSTLEELAFLYRRAGFGARSDDLSSAMTIGYEGLVEQWVGGLAEPDPAASKIQAPPSVSMGEYFRAHEVSVAKMDSILDEAVIRWPTLIQWWIARMVAAENPLTEKLTLLLHNLFPTAIAKVIFPQDMLVQNELFRSHGSGAFDDLVTLVTKDPAMLAWLDIYQPDASDPNENFGRELMERFTMGVGNYTQRDVKASAVCFTGILFDPSNEASYFESIHRTPQTLLGHHGVSNPEQVIEIVTKTAASHAYIPSRFWSWLAWPVLPGDPMLASLSEAYAADLNVSNLLRNIFLHPEFRSARAITGLVKQPVEYVARALRALRFSPQRIAAGKPNLYSALADMGQIPFDPPSVGGWGQNEAWLTSASALGRWRFATQLAGSQEADLSVVGDVSPRDRPQAAAELLSVASWSPNTAAALVRVAADPVEVVTQALISPEYVSN